MNEQSARLSRSQIECDRLISEHVEVARRISLRIARRCPDWIAHEDLMGAALLGLTEAAKRYDGARGEPFIGYAEKRIRGAILDELRRGDILPRRARAMARKIGIVIRDLESGGGTVTDDAVAAKLNVPVEEYRNNLEQLLHVTVGALETTAESHFASDASSPEHDATKRQALRRIRETLPTLGERDLLVLGLHYNDELSYNEIGRVLGISTSRVCQLHGRAIAQLRLAMERVQE